MTRLRYASLPTMSVAPSSASLPERFPRTLLCIPTFNEVENISELIRRIDAVSPKLDVLIIDDASPDGTAQAVKRLMEHRPGLHLMERPGKLGLGTAYLDGFRWGLQRDYDYFFCMDADLSHRPEHLPAFMQLLSESHVVVGSRYMPGGGVKNWGFHRIVLSRGANLLARTALGLPGRDLTSGFRGMHRPVAQVLVNSNLQTEGYAFLVEVLYTAQQAGFVTAQTPILFEDRRHGKSKLSKRIILEGAVMLLRMWWRRVRGA